VHQQNFELLAVGVYNPWVQQSLDKLAVMMPGRYAKNEISGGFVGSIDSYAYRMPIAPEIDVEGEGSIEISEVSNDETSVERAAQVAGDAGPDTN
jgi:hypothetical protein